MKKYVLELGETLGFDVVQDSLRRDRLIEYTLKKGARTFSFIGSKPAVAFLQGYQFATTEGK